MAGTGRPVPWGPVLVAVLAVAVGVLVFLALRPPTPPATVVTEAPEPSPSENVPATPEPTAEPTPTAALPAGPVRERPLDVLTADAAARAVPGACPGGGARVELTRDGGRTWVGVQTPADEVMRVSWAAEDDLWFVGAASDCAPGFWRSGDQGAAWDGPSGTEGAWHLLPDPAALRLHAPEGDVDSPCGASGTLELESLSAGEAFVLCGDGRVSRTTTAGESWQDVAAAPGALALGLLDGQPVVVQPGGEDCQGLIVGATTAEQRACLVDATADSVGLGFAAPGVGFVVAGPSTWVSNDRGQTWELRG